MKRKERIKEKRVKVREREGGEENNKTKMGKEVQRGRGKKVGKLSRGESKREMGKC